MTKIYLSGKVSVHKDISLKWKLIDPFLGLDGIEFLATDAQDGGGSKLGNHGATHNGDSCGKIDGYPSICAGMPECWTGRCSHGCGYNDGRYIPFHFTEQIKGCDLLLAILLDEPSYGSIAEMAYASAIGIPVNAIVPSGSDEHFDLYWFVLGLPNCVAYEVRGESEASEEIRQIINIHRTADYYASKCHHPKNWFEELKSKKGEKQEWWDCFNEYLKSQEWYAKHEAVMRRSGGICEGCLSNPAVMVHHRTYDRVGNELLFDLVAICRKCHETAHPGKSFEPESISDIIPRVLRNRGRSGQ